jgi:hypothetical protein
MIFAAPSLVHITSQLGQFTIDADPPPKSYSLWNVASGCFQLVHIYKVMETFQSHRRCRDTHAEISATNRFFP